MEAWIDFGLMTLTFFLSIFYNVEVGIIVSLIISLLLVVRRSSKTRMKILVSGYKFRAPTWTDFAGSYPWD